MAITRDKRAAAPGMPSAVVWRRIGELKRDPEICHSPSPKQIRQLAKSIAAFGFNVPIVIRPGLRVVAGYGRLLAARELGWSEVPTILVDKLSPAQARIFKIGDDRLAESASWDDLLLSMQLKELSAGELEFGEPHCRASGRGRRTARTPVSKPLPDAPATAARQGTGGRAARLQPAEVPVVGEGDVWLLGNHRLHCGSACDAIAEMLTEGDGAVVVFAADPASVDAIIRRWQTLTGGAAQRATGGRGLFSAHLGQADAHAGN